MKKQILSFFAVVTFLFVGCGGGGGSSTTYDNPEIIEDKFFYRVIAENTYLKERFDSNNSILEVETFENNVSDVNSTIPYEIKSSLIYIYDAITIRCSVIDSNVSVQFYCLEEGQSGLFSLYTTRWKTLEDAIENPEY